MLRKLRDSCSQKDFFCASWWTKHCLIGFDIALCKSSMYKIALKKWPSVNKGITCFNLYPVGADLKMERALQNVDKIGVFLRTKSVLQEAKLVAFYHISTSYFSLFFRENFFKMPRWWHPSCQWLCLGSLWAGSSHFPFSCCYQDCRKPQVSTINVELYSPSLRARGSIISPVACL